MQLPTVFSDFISCYISILFEENGDPRIARPSEVPSFGNPHDNTNSTTDPGYSSMKNNFTSEITSTETEGNSEEWVDNDDDWSEVATVEGTSLNATPNSTDELMVSEVDYDTNENISSNDTNEWVGGDGAKETSVDVTSSNTNEWMDNLSLNQDDQLSGDSSQQEEIGMCNGGRSGFEAAPGCR